MFPSLAEATEGQQHAASHTNSVVRARPCVRALAGSLQLVLNQKCMGPNVRCWVLLIAAAARSTCRFTRAAVAGDLGHSISDGSIHRIVSDNLILENMTHQSARRDSHHQRVDGSAARAYLWGYWRVYSGCPRTLLLPICLPVCQSDRARNTVFLQKLLFKRLNCQKHKRSFILPDS